jgi:SAM-dependent methyltransferase
MKTRTLPAELAAVIDQWRQALLDGDAAASARLREEGYASMLPGGVVVGNEEDLAMLASPRYPIESIGAPRVEEDGSTATVVFPAMVRHGASDRAGVLPYELVTTFRRTGGQWRAASTRVNDGHTAAPRAAVARRSFVPRRVRAWVEGRVKRIAAEAAPGFQEQAYLPYRPRMDYILPPDPPAAVGGELPVPPEELWLGYDYLANGEEHVARMLEIVRASGFELARGDRVLDLGCGAGRMIRYLRDLAATCEIWGADISAEHIFWCRRHLSPPFHFATTTKIPHLPFEDRGLNLIYCGSLFTHIDDLADAWLLELRRILAPGGRLYLTAHDNHTLELFKQGAYQGRRDVRWFRAQPVYQEAKGPFGMFTIARDENSQVFYDRAFLVKRLSSAFEVLSITEEAYGAQTAYLLRRR